MVLEKREIKKDGARPVKNSGRGKLNKGDAILGPFLYDIKEYEKSYSVSQNSWAKICSDAFVTGRRIPALKIVLGKENSKTRLWLIEDAMFKDMLEAWEEKYV